MSPSFGSVPRPPDDGKRVLALRSLGLEGGPVDPALDRIVRLAAVVVGTPYAALVLVDEDRAWAKAAQGPLPPSEARETAVAAHAIAAPDRILVVPDAAADSRFAQGPSVQGAPHLRFLVAAPLVLPGGAAIGGLCASAPEARGEPGAAVLAALRDLADVTVALLEAGARRSALAAAEAEIQRLAVVDPLTGLTNRRGFDDRLDDAVALGRRARLTAAVLMIHVDGVAELRSRLGSDVGDAVLIELAERLSHAVREHDLVARTGEDEFVVLLQAVDRAAVAEAAGRLHEALTSELDLPTGSGVEAGSAADDGAAEPVSGAGSAASDQPAVRIRASVGVALHPGDGEDVASLLRAADLAMYEAKAAGGGVRRFTAGSSTRT